MRTFQLKDLPLQYKLTLISGVPLIVLFFFAFQRVQATVEQAAALKQLERVVQLSRGLGGLVHELQRERGTTGIVLVRRDERFEAELAEQRKRTDAMRAEVEPSIKGLLGADGSKDLGEYLPGALALLEGLESLRQWVDASKIGHVEAIDAYSAVNEMLIDSVAMLSNLPLNQDVQNRMHAHLAILRVKELLGVQRALLSAAFAADRFEGGGYERFIENVRAQQINFSDFRLHADPDERTRFEAIFAGPEAEEISRMEGLARSMALTGGFGVDPVRWFELMTARIDALQELESHQRVSLSERTAALSAEGWRELVAVAGFSIFALLFAFGIASYVGRGITQSLTSAVEVANRIAKGDLTARPRASSKDEIGRLLGSLGQMVDNLRAITHTLQHSVSLLDESVVAMSSAAEQQRELAEQQGEAIQVTAVSVREIRQTSQVASERAQAVTRVAENAERVSASGAEAIASSLSGLAEVQQLIESMARQVGSLGGRAREIRDITSTVGRLARQSHLLALNAAIETTRVGSQAAGFQVIARDMRQLAEQSLELTQRAEESLGQIGVEIDAAAKMTEESLPRIESGLWLVRDSGERFGEFAGIVLETAAAGRDIAAAVVQQNAGIGQISAAVDDQRRMVEEVGQAAAATEAAARALRGVAGQVSSCSRTFVL